MKAIHKLGRTSAALTVTSVLLVSAGGLAAWADEMVTDGDGLTPIADTATVNLGSIACNVPVQRNVLVALVRTTNGSPNIFQNSSSSTVSVTSVSNPQVTTSGTPDTISVPSNWADSNPGAISSDYVTVAATVTPTSAGAGTAVISLGASGIAQNGSALQRADSITLNWNATNCDSTVPVITPTVTGTLGANGWYTSNVNVSWAVTDAQSSVTSTTGCTPSSVTSDTSGATFTCSATSAGGTASQSVTVKRDATAPNISALLESNTHNNPAASGWWNQTTGAPTAKFTCDDATSGVASCEPDYLFGEGEGQSKTGTVTDNAGNTASTDVTNVDVDLTAPTADAELTGDEGDDGWFVGNVNVVWTVVDALSGPIEASCPDDTVAADGTGDLTCTPQDNAGNTGTAILKPYKRDATPPTISAALDATADALTGWFNIATGAPTVTYTCNDLTSGLKSCTEPHQFGEGADQTHTGTAKDNAGNTNTATVNTINVDLTAPEISYELTGPLGDGDWYTGDVTINWTVTDSGSGVDVDCPSETLFTDSPSHSFSCSAEDNAGNTYSDSVTIKRDATAPSVTPTIAGTEGNDNWYTSDVSLTWTVSDGAGSGVDTETGCESHSVTDDTPGVSFTCTASDEAGNSSPPQTVTIKRDATKPDLGSALINGTVGANGWYTSDVNVDWTPDDATSGIHTTHGCTAVVEEDTTGVELECTATDKAGNSRSDTVTVKRDATAPNISALLESNTHNNPAASGWWNQTTGAPTAKFTCDDATSGVASCEPDYLFGEGEGQSKTGTVTDNAGNTASTDVTNVDVDLTAPTADAELTGDEGDDGWFVGNVNVVWTVVDALSGPIEASCPDDTVAADGTGDLTCTPQDNAGNTGTAILKPYKRDATPPTISAALDATADALTGWFNIATGAPTVTYTCNDLTSGLKSCTEPHQFGEGADQTHTGTAKDNAGNTNTATVNTINVDLTAPSVAHSVSGTIGDNGWYVSDVDVSFQITESGSGVATTAPDCDGASVTSDTASVTFSCTVIDAAGNTSAVETVTVKRDATQPTIVWNSLIDDGDSDYFGTVPAEPTCSATDNLSGIADPCEVGGYATTVGNHNLTASATDEAGNVASESRNYSVLAWTPSGFFRPVDMNHVLNTVKGGSTVPLKFEVYAGPTELTDVASTVKSYNVATILCSTVGSVVEDPIEQLASTGGTTMRYDWVEGQFIQNWQTPKKPGVCFQATVKFQDGSRLDAFFKLK